MPLVINTNVSSLNSQRQLVSSGNALDQAMERLSSGRRVNTAGDDAAGLAIANRMTSQIRGLDQAIRNANDGVSLIQTAEGALDESTNILQRMRELAIQSANGIYSDVDRATLDAESQQLKSELKRIADSTSFNGQALLDGSLSDVTLQVGAEEGDTIDLSIGAFDPSSLGGASGDIVGQSVATSVGAAVNALSVFTATAAALTLVVNDVSLPDLSAGTTLNDKLNIINAELEGKGAEASAIVFAEADSAGDGVMRAGTDELTITLEDGDDNDQVYVITGTNSMDELVEKINTETLISASLGDDGKLLLAADGATSITLVGTGRADSATGYTSTSVTNFSLIFNDTTAENSGVKIETAAAASAAALQNLGINLHDDQGDIVSFVSASASAALNQGDLIINGVEIGVIADAAASVLVTNVVTAINLSSDETGVVAAAIGTSGTFELISTRGNEISIEYGDAATAANVTSMTGLLERNAAEGAGSVAGIDISTQPGATRSLDIIDKALEQINDVRADLGAINNRLDFTMSNLANVVEKTTASRSRIVDADFAAESANLSRAQVLQQASQAMLAQANARPQQVLSLLQ